ncbi:MAG: zinc ribbon domain-containing protein [Thermoplasmata archaeon]
MRIHRELRCPSCGRLSPLSSKTCPGCGRSLVRERDAVEVESIFSEVRELIQMIQAERKEEGVEGEGSGESLAADGWGGKGAAGAGREGGEGKGCEGLRARTGGNTAGFRADLSVSPDAPVQTVKDEEMFRCAICGSRVLAEATVCKICGTVLDIQPVPRLVIKRIGRTAGEIAPGEVELAQGPGHPDGRGPNRPLDEARPPPTVQTPTPDTPFARGPVMKKRVVRRVLKGG